jgi:hypothetical protein
MLFVVNINEIKCFYGNLVFICKKNLFLNYFCNFFDLHNVDLWMVTIFEAYI